MNTHTTKSLFKAMTLSFGLLSSALLFTQQASAADAPTELCPPLGWSEHLSYYLGPDAQMPTTAPQTDCDFHEWSWEAFIWATANINGAPRFMSFPTPAELGTSGPPKQGVRKLRLGARSLMLHGMGNAQLPAEMAGAIVEADGNMLVAPNGYPVLASVHMNDLYFDKARQNLVSSGGYQNNPNQDDYFPVGSFVVKATWLRLDSLNDAPAGSFTTMASVPVLTVDNSKHLVVPTGKFVTAPVALVGVHVVGETMDHPEFLWGTFEHNLNSPRVPDNTFSPSGSDAQGYTFYPAGTSYAKANIANQSPPNTVTFNEATQKFSPMTNVVLQNATGGENHSPLGPQNIANLNQSSHSFLSNYPSANKLFANYDLIGTVWMGSNTYVTTTPNWQNMAQQNAVGSVSLANSTAETFQQARTNAVSPSHWQNCFECHNPQVFAPGLPPLNPRRIAISHVLEHGTPYAVQNVMPICQDVNAGPIWDNYDAQAKCPTTCKNSGNSSWNGQWTTTQPGVMSVCGCCGNNE